MAGLTILNNAPQARFVGSKSTRVVMIGLVGSRWMAPRLLHAQLENAGFNVRTVFFREDFEFVSPPEEREYKALIALLEEFEPDLVGLGFVSYFLRDAIEMTRRIRETLTSTPIVWGGIHPSLEPEESLEHADMVCIGEGDEAVVELAASIQAEDGRTDIQNIWFKKDGEIIRNESRPLLHDLTSQPWADFSDDNKFYIVGGEVHRESNPTHYHKREYDILTARGCPYICSFCVNHISFGEGKRLRRRSVEDVIGELKLAMEREPELKRIQFWDDVFTYDKNWLAEFAPVYKKEIGLPFFCYVHPQMIARPQAKLLSEMGAADVTMGIQHGSARIRKEYFDRLETDEQIIEAVAGLIDNGMTIRVDVISSALTNSEEDNRENMELLLKLPKPFIPSMHGMNYFPSYKLTKMALDRGVITADEVVGRSSRRKVKVTDEEIEHDPWLCYTSMLGKRYVPNSLIRLMIRHDFHNRYPALLSSGTNWILRGGRMLAGLKMIKRLNWRSIPEIPRYVIANFVNR